MNVKVCDWFRRIIHCLKKKHNTSVNKYVAVQTSRVFVHVAEVGLKTMGVRLDTVVLWSCFTHGEFWFGKVKSILRFCLWLQTRFRSDQSPDTDRMQSRVQLRSAGSQCYVRRTVSDQKKTKTVRLEKLEMWTAYLALMQRLQQLSNNQLMVSVCVHEAWCL